MSGETLAPTIEDLEITEPAESADPIVDDEKDPQEMYQERMQNLVDELQEARGSEVHLKKTFEIEEIVHADGSKTVLWNGQEKRSDGFDGNSHQQMQEQGFMAYGEHNSGSIYRGTEVNDQGDKIIRYTLIEFADAKDIQNEEELDLSEGSYEINSQPINQAEFQTIELKKLDPVAAQPEKPWFLEYLFNDQDTGHIENQESIDQILERTITTLFEQNDVAPLDSTLEQLFPKGHENFSHVRSGSISVPIVTDNKIIETFFQTPKESAVTIVVSENIRALTGEFQNYREESLERVPLPNTEISENTKVDVQETQNISVELSGEVKEVPETVATQNFTTETKGVEQAAIPQEALQRTIEEAPSFPPTRGIEEGFTEQQPPQSNELIHQIVDQTPLDLPLAGENEAQQSFPLTRGIEGVSNGEEKVVIERQTSQSVELNHQDPAELASEVGTSLRQGIEKSANVKSAEFTSQTIEQVNEVPFSLIREKERMRVLSVEAPLTSASTADKQPSPREGRGEIVISRAEISHIPLVEEPVVIEVMNIDANYDTTTTLPEVPLQEFFADSTLIEQLQPLIASNEPYVEIMLVGETTPAGEVLDATVFKAETIGEERQISYEIRATSEPIEHLSESSVRESLATYEWIAPTAEQQAVREITPVEIVIGASSSTSARPISRFETIPTISDQSIASREVPDSLPVSSLENELTKPWPPSSQVVNVDDADDADRPPLAQTSARADRALT